MPALRSPRGKARNFDIRCLPGWQAAPPLEHDPEKHALGLDPMGGNRFSEKITLQDDG
jgi:hypothetical protein